MTAPQPIVLAAGASTRMGHPKALTRIGGETALERIGRALQEAGLGAPLVVVRHVAGLPEVGRFVVNDDPDAGRTGSLQAGLRAPGVAARDIIVWPVDHPLARAATVRALLGASGAWVVPEHAGRGGHPIVLRGAALDAVRAAKPEAPLRDVLRGAGLAPTRVAVNDAGVLANLDTPEDVAEAAGGRRKA